MVGESSWVEIQDSLDRLANRLPSLNLKPQPDFPHKTLSQFLSGGDFVARLLWQETRAGLGPRWGTTHSSEVPSPSRRALPLEARDPHQERVLLAVPGVGWLPLPLECPSSAAQLPAAKPR